MWEKLVQELGGRGATATFGMVIGSVVTWMLARWRRRREKKSVRSGDARETIVLHHHIVERAEEIGPDAITRTVPAILRVRTVGQAELTRVVSNGHLASILSRRARAVTTRETLISMDGAEGSYLLETLTDFVCDRLANGAFPHDRYVMAPCCEPKELSHYQPLTILIVSVADLMLFEEWATCRGVRVEHGSDGARVLTLMALARRYRSEQEHLVTLRNEGKRTQYAETMYVLDLALDKKVMPLESKPIPWERFEAVLKNLELQ